MESKLTSFVPLENNSETWKCTYSIARFYSRANFMITLPFRSQGSKGLEIQSAEMNMEKEKLNG